VKDEISRRFVVNLARVRGLITSYEQALPGVQGRPTVATTDILRGAVVFLHASLEDLLRSILEWKLPSTAKPEHLDDVPLDGERLRKYTLGDVARHRGTTVDDLIDRSVKAWANSVETFGKAVLALLRRKDSMTRDELEADLRTLPDLRKLEVVGNGTLIATVVSGSFEGQDEAVRQRTGWSLLRGRHGSQQIHNVEFIFTRAPGDAEG
jgi:acid stress-induced BolA-like protein IbaG/YrbA